MLKQFIYLSLAGSLLLTACEVPINYEESTQDSSEEPAETQESTDNTSNETSSNSSSCDEEACFAENFKTCESATMSSDLGFAAVAYEILGATTEGCEVEMVYTKNPNPAWVDQPIACTLDMDADFLPAWQKEFEAAVEGEGNCTGPLTEILKDL